MGYRMRVLSGVKVLSNSLLPVILFSGRRAFKKIVQSTKEHRIDLSQLVTISSVSERHGTSVWSDHPPALY